MMSTTELIKILTDLRSKHGDVPVFFMDDRGKHVVNVSGYYKTATTSGGLNPFVGIQIKSINL